MGTRFLIESVLLLPLLCLLGVAVARYSRNAEGRVRDFLLGHGNYSARDRPVLNSDNTVYVGLQIQIYAMLDLNERDEVLTTASWLTLYWTDQRLTWNPADFEGKDLLVMYPDEIWIPKVFLSNSLNKEALGATFTDRGSIVLTSDGFILYGMPMVQSTQCPMNIGNFPFDTQICSFSFVPENQIDELVSLVAHQSQSPSEIQSLEWDLLNVTVRNFAHPIKNYVPNRNLSWYTTAHVCVALKRDANYYIMGLILPSTLMCLMAFVTFLAPPDSGERISLGVSMVLGLTVFQLLIADMLPTSSKQTPILSKYLTFNFVLACLAVPFSLININMACADKKLQISKYPWMRKLCLEYLPCWLCIPTYHDRVRREVIGARTFPGTTNEENTDTKMFVMSNNAVEDNEKAVMKDELSSNEKIKLEARTFALVMDRVILIIFLIAFVGYVIKILVDYGSIPQVTSDICPAT